VRFLKSFGVPQQLGAGSMRVEPAYFQIYLGLGVGFHSAQTLNATTGATRVFA